MHFKTSIHFFIEVTKNHILCALTINWLKQRKPYLSGCYFQASKNSLNFLRLTTPNTNTTQGNKHRDEKEYRRNHAPLSTG